MQSPIPVKGTSLERWREPSPSVNMSTYTTTRIYKHTYATATLTIYTSGHCFLHVGETCFKIKRYEARDALTTREWYKVRRHA